MAENSQKPISSKFLAGMALSGTLALGGALSSPVQAEGREAPVPDDVASAQQENRYYRNYEINQKIIQAAQKEVLGILDQSRTAYSSELEILQGRFTRRLQAETGKAGSQVIYVDPNAFDSAAALGFSGDESLQKALEQKDFSQKLDLDSASFRLHYSSAGVVSYQSNPQILHYHSHEDASCVVTPPMPFINIINIPGFTQQDKIVYTNLHEGWHCMDSKYMKFYSGPLPSEQNMTNMKELFRSVAILEAASNYNRRETFADLGAAGDMIRQGYPTDIIEKISTWRTAEAARGDVGHFTVEGLEKLREKIDTIGVATFRALEEKDLKDIYYEITDKNALSPRKIRIFGEYALANPMQRLGIHLRALVDSETKAVLRVLDKIAQATAQNDAATPADLEKKIEKVDMRKTLEERAIKIGAGITPQSLVKAYAELQTEFQLAAKADPNNPLYSPLQAKLRITFISSNIRSGGYLEANERNGINPAEVPALKKFLQTTQKTPAPLSRSPQHGSPKI